MKNTFITPEIELLIFDEKEILTDSAPIPNTFAAGELNNYMFGHSSASGTTTIKIEKAAER